MNYIRVMEVSIRKHRVSLGNTSLSLLAAPLPLASWKFNMHNGSSISLI
jgi:hypothetical protein